MTAGGVTAAIATGVLITSTVGAPPSVASGESAPATAKAGPTYGNLWNILPPGSSGNVTTADLATLHGSTATPTAPPHVADQLEMYDALTKRNPDRISQGDIDKLYKREDFTPATVVSTQSPRPGVTIQRDTYGVPFINGATFDD